MRKTFKENALSALFVSLIICSLSFAASYGIDKSMDNKEKMLCNSALYSGNTNYNC